MKQPIMRMCLSLALGLGLTLAVLVLASGQVPLARADGPWFVASSGNDSHGCLSAGDACLTINAAVGKASTGDTINIGPGEWFENVSISGKALTFVGAGAADTIVDGGGSDRVFDSDSNLAVSDLTVENGNATAGDGGGLHTSGALTLTNVEVLNNIAFFSGGGAFADGPAAITGSLFQGNSGAQGGGVYINNSLDLSATTFMSNTTSGWGGGARAVLAFSVNASHFEGNSADSGGGLYADADLTLANTTFVSNTAVNFAGGAYLNDTGTLAGASFSGNSADSGGGADFNGPANLTGTTFYSNTAVNVGGGAYFNAIASLTNTAFTQNINLTTTAGGGGAVFGFTATVSGGSFTSNTTHFAGGGAYFGSEADLSGTNFSGNTATTNRGGGAYFNGHADIEGGSFTANQTLIDRGAGAYFRVSAVVSGTDFVSNVSANRAGGALFFGPALVVSTRFLSNTAAVHGGGAYFNDNFILIESIFMNNTATTQNGGAVFASGTGSGTFVNELFTRNQAGGDGADVLLDTSGATTLLHTTLANASVNPGAAVVVDKGSVYVTNTLFANYAAGLAISGIATASSDYNLFFNAPTNAITGSHSLTGTNPLFVNPAADNYHLGAGSPAASAGINEDVPTDLDGALRGNPPSIGAYELATYTLTVSKTGTGLGTVGVVPSHTVYALGTVVTLTATPNGGSTFAGWSGAVSGLANPISLTMTSNKSVTATFNLIPPPAADLRVGLRGAPSQAPAGAWVTYTLVVTNTGPAVASSVRLTDTLSANSTFRSLSTPGGWSCQAPSVGSSGAVVCTTGSLAVGAPATFTLTAQLRSTLAPAAIVTDMATATSATTDPTTPNMATATTVIYGNRLYLPLISK